MMIRIISVLIQNSLYKNKTEGMLNIVRSGIYLISLFPTSSLVYVLIGRILNYYPSYPTRRLYFREVEIAYCGLYPPLKVTTLNQSKECFR